MMDGSSLICEGIIGDGCGGGRLFIIEDGVLYAENKDTREKMILLKDIKNPKKISKNGCIITIECDNSNIEFDLSSLSVKK